MGRKFAQRRENEAPFPHARVRNEYRRIGADDVTEEEDVDVERSRTPPLHSNAMRRLFSDLATREELLGRISRIHRDNQVPKRILLDTTYRLGFVHRGNRQRPVATQRLDASLEVGSPIPQVGAEGKIRGGHVSATRCR